MHINWAATHLAKPPQQHMAVRQQCMQALHCTITQALLQLVMMLNNDSIECVAFELWTSNPAAANCADTAPATALDWILLHLTMRQKTTM